MSNNGNGQHVTGSARIVATAAPTTNVEKADLTINTPEALLALQNHEIQQRQENKVNLLKKALDGYAALTTNFGPTDFVRGAAFNFLLDGAKDIDAECGYPPWLMPQQYNYMFDREPIANRVVTCLPEETWAEDPEIWEDDDPDTETPFEETWAALEEQHNLFSMLQRADVLSGIGQFGIILIGIDDGKDLREPVDGIFDDGTVDPEVEHKLLYIRTFSEVVVFVKVREIDITNPRYSLPKIYTVQYRDYPNWGVQAGEIIARDVHWTRVIHLADNRKESEVYGIPRMQPVYNRLYDLRKIYSASGEGYWKGAFPGLAFEVTPEVAAQGVELDVASIRQEMERFQNGLQKYLALTGVTTKSLPAEMMEPGGTVETHLRAIAICLGIPERILWGSEEAVLAGNQDSRAWNKRLGKRQTKYVNPLIIRPFINRFIAMGILPPPKDCMQKVEGEGEGTFIITGGYKIEWPDLNAPTEMDKAQVAAAETSAMAAYVQGGVSQLMAPREYLTHVMGYSVDEADAILEASMEFSGDEEEPLSAASQAAQEQEAAEQEHDQAMEMQDAKAKGGKGENTKPERNSTGDGLEVNSEDVEVNPDKKTIGRLFQDHIRVYPKDVPTLRYVMGKKNVYVATGYNFTHNDVRDHIPREDISPHLDAHPENGSEGVKGPQGFFYKKDNGGMSVESAWNGQHEKDHPYFKSLGVAPNKYHPSRLETNVEKIDKDFILHNPDKGKLQAFFDTVAHRTEPNDPWRKGNQRTGEYVLRGMHDKTTGEHRWADANHFEHGELMQGRHYGASGQLAEPMYTSKEGALSVKADGRIMRQSVEGDDVPHSVPGIGGKLKPAKALVANAAFTVLPNPKPTQLHKMLAEHNKELQNPQVGKRYAPASGLVLRGIVDADTGEHYWAKGAYADHGDLRDRVDRRGERNFYDVEMHHDSNIYPGSSEIGDHGEDHLIAAAHLKKAGLTLNDSEGMETNSQWQNGWKTEPAQSKSERLARQILTNPSRSDLQHLLDSVHQHNQDNNISYSPLKIVLRGVSNDDGTKHNWGSSYFHEHKDLKQGDHSLDNHLYVSTSGHIAKMGRMGGFEPFNVPAIGPKLDKVSAERVGMKTNADPTRGIITNPSKGELQAFLDTVHHKYGADTDMFTGGSGDTVLKGIIHKETGSHHWGAAHFRDHGDLIKQVTGKQNTEKKTYADFADEHGYERLHVGARGDIFRHPKDMAEVDDDRGPLGPFRHYEVPGIGSKLKSVGKIKDAPTGQHGIYWGSEQAGAMASNAEPLHQQILTNPPKRDLQALFDAVHHRLESAQALGPDDAVLRGVVSRDGTKHVWGNAFQYEHEDLKDKSGDSDIAKGSHVYVGPTGKIWKFGRGFGFNRYDDYDVPGIGSKLKPATAPAYMVGNVDKDREFSSTQIQLNPSIADRIKAMGMQIPDSELADDGRETDPHVTLKYGLHTNDPNDVSALLHGEPAIRYKLGKTSLFPASGDRDYDVVKVDVHSPDLHRINAKIAGALEHTDTHPEYKPHATVAYVKAGMGKKYEGLDDCEGLHGVCGRVIFSGKEKDNKTSIQLTMNKARPRDMLHDQDQNLTPPQEDQPKPYAEVENLPGDQDEDDEEQRGEGGLGGANPDNGDALATPNLSREGVKHPVDPEMIQLPTLNVDGGMEFKTYKVVDGDVGDEQE